MNFNTALLHNSFKGDPATGATLTTICQTSAFAHESAEKLDPKEQLAAVKDTRANGLVPLGNWHSHPESPSRPSEEDKRLAFDSKSSYLILSLMDINAPVLNSFRIIGDKAEDEGLTIEKFSEE